MVKSVFFFVSAPPSHTFTGIAGPTWRAPNWRWQLRMILEGKDQWSTGKNHRIGLLENLQDTPIFDGKKHVKRMVFYGFSCKPMNLRLKHPGYDGIWTPKLSFMRKDMAIFLGSCWQCPMQILCWDRGGFIPDWNAKDTFSKGAIKEKQATTESRKHGTQALGQVEYDKPI